MNTNEKDLSSIIVIINQNSGGQCGLQFYNSFLKYLNQNKVLKISQMENLNEFQHDTKAKLIVAGGDGTVSAVVNYIKSIKWNVPIAILPLGTGNDLSRSLGWVLNNILQKGKEYQSLDAQYMIDLVKNNQNITQLDIWKVKLKHQEYKMLNYFGIGLDAKFCYEFHQQRLQNPENFKNRIGNKWQYTKIGFNELISNKNNEFSQSIKLMVDDIEIKIPSDIENIIVLNINSWSGGVTGLWKSNETHKPQNFNDGLLEIIGVSNTLHLGTIQARLGFGLNAPYQLAQGKKIVIWYSINTYIQIDGEPLQVEPQVIEISLIDQVNVLLNQEQTWSEKITKKFEQANEAKDDIINNMIQYFQ